MHKRGLKCSGRATQFCVKVLIPNNMPVLSSVTGATIYLSVLRLNVFFLSKNTLSKNTTDVRKYCSLVSPGRQNRLKKNKSKETTVRGKPPLNAINADPNTVAPEHG